MKIKVLALIVSIALFAGGIAWVVDVDNSCPFAYSGEIMFNSEDEYMKFKELVVSGDVKINDMAVLSSEPPIWVRYDVTYDANRVFPYEYESRYRDRSGLPSLYTYGLSFIIAIGLLGVIASVIWLAVKEEGNRGIKAESDK